MDGPLQQNHSYAREVASNSSYQKARTFSNFSFDFLEILFNLYNFSAKSSNSYLKKEFDFQVIWQTSGNPKEFTNLLTNSSQKAPVYFLNGMEFISKFLEFLLPLPFDFDLSYDNYFFSVYKPKVLLMLCNRLNLTNGKFKFNAQNS